MDNEEKYSNTPKLKKLSKFFPNIFCNRIFYFTITLFYERASLYNKHATKEKITTTSQNRHLDYAVKGNIVNYVVNYVATPLRPSSKAIDKL